MNIKRSQVVAVLSALGIKEDGYERWEEKNIVASKLKRIENFKNSPDHQFGDPKVGLLFEELVAASKKGEEVVIEDDRPAGTPEPAAKPAPAAPATQPAAKPVKTPTIKPTKPGKTAKPAKAKPEAKPVKPAKTKERKPAAEKVWAGYGIYAEKPLEFSERGPGVGRAIVTILEKAGDAGKPLTKEEIHDKLVAKFKDRDPKQLLTSVNNQVPSRLRLVRGIHVWKSKNKAGETAYFIDKDTKGDKPQPKAEKPAKEEKPAKAAAKPSTNGKPAAGKPAKKKKQTAAA